MNDKKKIGIASDHAGFEYKELIKNEILKTYEVQDFGTFSAASMDYPDVAHSLAESVSNGILPMAVILCGSGNGVCMTVNKHKNVRGALCWNEEIARLARLHNDANVICLPARFLNVDQLKKIMDAFLTTDFEGDRHQRRVEKINL